MFDYSYQTEVYEQLAQQLVKDEVELAQKRLAVESTQNYLMGKKEDLIMEAVRGKVFALWGKKYRVLSCNTSINYFEMVVSITFGQLPDDIELDRYHLTKKEKELIEEYRVVFRTDRFYHGSDEDKKAIHIAQELKMLKNSVALTFYKMWYIGNNQFQTPGFFEGSGLKIKDLYGVAKPLESYVIR